jgi:hypothetical protein
VAVSTAVLNDSRYVETIFNIVGVQNAEFLEEVVSSGLIKKNEVYFALLVNGLAGEPDFGVGLSTMVGELNVRQLKRFIEDKIENGLPDLVDGITLNDYVINQDVKNQLIAVDLELTDNDSDEPILIPVGFKLNK